LARHTESLCRLCRRENLKLFLKGRGAIRRSAPTTGGITLLDNMVRSEKFSDYGLSFGKNKKSKGCMEFRESVRNIFKEADRQKGITEKPPFSFGEELTTSSTDSVLPIQETSTSARPTQPFLGQPVQSEHSFLSREARRCHRLGEEQESCSDLRGFGRGGASRCTSMAGIG